MSRRFGICVAKGDRGYFRPSYGRPKFTLFSEKEKRILWEEVIHVWELNIQFFFIFFWNPECVRIFCVYALKIFSIEHFCVQSDLRKSSVFHGFPCPYPPKNNQVPVPTNLMPPTFPIASLSVIPQTFQGGAWLTWWHRFCLQLSMISGVFRCFFWTK